MNVIIHLVHFVSSLTVIRNLEKKAPIEMENQILPLNNICLYKIVIKISPTGRTRNMHVRFDAQALTDKRKIVICEGKFVGVEYWIKLLI